MESKINNVLVPYNLNLKIKEERLAVLEEAARRMREDDYKEKELLK